jgi:uncharacterized membrane protein YoaK (UPF0700 family)
MLRHTGQKRSFRHNLQLAILLCFTAGFINAAGFFGFGVLTTNVTGHTALLGVDLATSHVHAADAVALWLALFLAGAFTSGLLVSKAGKDKASAYTVPILIILIVVSLIATLDNDYDRSSWKTDYYAGSLLFAMGVQNAFVTMLSGAEVRTTHLTGMFTDLGIDLSTLVTSRGGPIVRNRIVLRSIIILLFLLGCVTGAFLFLRMKFHAFFIPAAILVIALFFDYLRIKLKWVFRKTQKDIT